MNIEYEKQYKFEEVKGIVRNKQLYILDKVVEICDKYNLIYWLDGGTLLGAVRHKGFIPWDDDIDIALMRESYEKLLSVLPNELPNDLIVQSRKTDSKYGFPFVKVRDIYSKIEDLYDYNGIFIDIFPFDKIPKSNLLKNIQYILILNYEIMAVHKDINNLNAMNKDGFKFFLKKALIKFLSSIGKIIPNDFFDIYYNLIVKMYQYSNGNEIGDGLAVSWAYYKSIRHYDVYLPISKVEFMGKLYNAPNNIDLYLKSLYGKDYMVPVYSKNNHMDTVIFHQNNNGKP